MLFRRTWAIAHKELRHIGRNRLTLFLVTLSPAMLLFLLAYVFALNVDQADLAVLDLSRSLAARDYVSRITASGSLRAVADAANYQEIDRLLVAGAVDAALVIPPDFDRQLASPTSAQVQLVVDGSNPIIANQIMGMVRRASGIASAGLRPALRQLAPAFEVRSRAWYNDSLSSQISMVPGLLAIVLSLPALALTLSLTREKELGTLEGLIATPLEGLAYLAGKMSTYIVTGLAGLLLSLADGRPVVPCALPRPDGPAGCADRGLLPSHHGHQPADRQPHLQPTDRHDAGHVDLLRAQLLPRRADRPHRSTVGRGASPQHPPARHPLHHHHARPVPQRRRPGDLGAAQPDPAGHGALGPVPQHPPVQKETRLTCTIPPSSFIIHHSSFPIPMFSRTWHVIVKELLHFRRDRVLTIFIFVFPLVQLVLVAQTAGNDPSNLPLAVWDQDHSAVSRQITRALDNTSELALRYLPTSQHEVQRLMDTGQAAVAVIIPPGFAVDLARAGAPATVQIIVDGSNVSGGSTTLAAAEGAISSTLLQRLAGAADLATALASPVELQTLVRFNPELKGKYIAILGLFAFVVYQIAMVVASVTLVRERELGTLEQLAVTPIRRIESAQRQSHPSHPGQPGELRNPVGCGGGCV